MFQIYLLSPFLILYLSLSRSRSLFLSLSPKLSFAEDQGEGQKAGLDSKELLFLVQIGCQVPFLSHNTSSS